MVGTRLGRLAGVIAALLVCAGCQRALFTDKTPRTQFETYDLVRERYIPLKVPDAFGNPQPALRARLSRTR